MKILIFVLVIVFTSSFNLFSQNELNSELKALVEKNQLNSSDSLFAEYTKGNLMDPQLYIDYANILYNKSRHSIINLANDTLKSNQIGFNLIDSTGKKAASMTELVTYDTVLAQKAIGVLKSCLTKFEYRLDVRFGIAYMYQQIDDFDNQYKIIVEAINYSKNNPDKIRWTDDEKFEQPPLDVVADALYNYSVEENNKETEKGDEQYLKLSQLLNEQFPKHKMSHTNIAYYYYNKKDWTNCLKYFLIADSVHPNDNNILYNIAENYIMLKDIENGKKYLNKLIQLNTDSDMVKYAKNRLNELK